MVGGYTDTPHNMAEITPFVIVDKESAAAEVLRRQKCFFYDTCSFRRHAQLSNTEAEYLLKYIKEQDGIIIVTRCILMELASRSGILNSEYVEYIRHIKEFGIPVLVIFEEDLFTVMEVCFGTNASINQYLCWAVRLMKGPVSTITRMLELNGRIHDEVIKGRNLDSRDVFKRFFEAVRSNKEPDDNLGEELLAICLHMLSYLPGEEDGKFCIITDDLGAASRIDALFKSTALKHRGKRIILFSTPKLVQILHRENILTDRAHMAAILNAGRAGEVVVLGTLIYDIRPRRISAAGEELAELIMRPDGVKVIF